MNGVDVNENGAIQGWGAVFGNLDSHLDIIAPGAFKETLLQSQRQGRLPQMLLMHSMGNGTVMENLPCGNWTDIRETDYGLWCEGQLLNTSVGRDVYQLVKSRAVDGLSIGYNIMSFEIPKRGSGAKRILKAVRLGEVSIVDRPSNPEARITRIKSRADDAVSRALAKLAAAVRA